MRPWSADARPRGSRRALGSVVVAATALAALLAPGATRSATADLGDIEVDVDSWHPTEAKRRLDSLSEADRESSRGQYARGKLLFFEGEFDSALALLRSAIEGARAEIDWKLLRDRVAETAGAIAGLRRVPGPSGRFSYRFAVESDALLVGYAEETLTAQLAVLEAELRDGPDFTVEVAFLPDVESLAAASGLSVEQIERTGTVGVTKHGRIMVISPRKLAAGYPWLDTLAHELSHVAITRLSRNQAPVWLQEGLAKLLELRWRGEQSGILTPEEAYLLDRAAREGRLIPLRGFHPSIAHLPNQEDAALAYAQALGFTHYLSRRFEPGWIGKLLRRLGEGVGIDRALVELCKFDLNRLYLWWRQDVSGHRQTPVPAVGLLQRRFKRGAVANPGGQDQALSVDVRRHLRVGDLLRLRGHVRAASSEYREAERLAVSPSPEISDRLAACLLELGDTAEAVEMLRRIAELYPYHSTVFIQLGESLAREDKLAEAEAALVRANAINPFHPAVHCDLAEIYRKLGRIAAAEQQVDHCRLVAEEAATDSGGEAR